MTLPFPRAAAGPALRFAVTGADHDPHAAGPTLRLHATVADSTGSRVHSIALRAQVRIEPAQRRYGAGEQERLVELFGEPSRWGRTLNPMQLATVSVMVPSFIGEREVTLEVPMTRDTDIASTRYFAGLEAGEVPLLVLFSGTVFYQGETGVQVGLVPWHEEASFGLPVALWRDMMTAHFGGSAWLQVPLETLERLSAWRAARALPTWAHTFDALLDGIEVRP